MKNSKQEAITIAKNYFVDLEYNEIEGFANSMNLYDLLDDGMWRINRFISILRHSSIEAATAVVAVLISSRWQPNGGWNCPSDAEALANWQVAKKILNKRVLKESDLIQYQTVY